MFVLISKLNTVKNQVREFCSANNVATDITDYYYDRTTIFAFSYVHQGYSPTFEIRSSSFTLSWLTFEVGRDLGAIADSIIKYIKNSIFKNEQENKEMDSYTNTCNKLKLITLLKNWATRQSYQCSVVFWDDDDNYSTDIIFTPGGTFHVNWNNIDSVDKTASDIIEFVSAKNNTKQNYYKTLPAIEKVIFNDPATIIFWKDGTKTVVKCSENDEFNPEVGMAMAISKKALGNKGNYCNEFKKWVEPYYEEAQETFISDVSKLFEEIGERLSKHRFETGFNSPIEKSESLKSVETGKAIGEGFVDGMKDESGKKKVEKLDTFSSDIITFKSFDEAERILFCMTEILHAYGFVSVSDWYDLCGEHGAVCWIHNKFGWKNLSDAVIQKGGFRKWIIELPTPERVD